ncbi:MAG: LytS/YhcK type 5TM receptor domain-containing protein [Desulfomicrobiaceae bacterium]
MDAILTLFPRLAMAAGLIASAAFVVFSLGPLRRLGLKPHSPLSTLTWIGVFGVFGILGTYVGDPVQHSYANLRAMSIITAGLFGGPLVGLGAGVVAGAHRILIDIGGFSALPCAIATIVEGLGAGLLARREPRLSAGLAIIAAMAGESLHMGLVLILSRPLDEAMALVRIIAAPMILLNAAGAGVLTHLIAVLFQLCERRDAHQAHTILALADRTVTHLRHGLTPATAAATARILWQELGVAAVAITDTTCVLAHVGEGADHHRVHEPIRTQATRQVLESGQAVFLRSAKDIGCDHPGCPFTAAILVPLHKGERVVGSLKLYGTRAHPLDAVFFQLTQGLGRLFSSQLELEDIHRSQELLAQAEIRRLQAQMNPHFLFNALGAVASFCRTDPGRARELLLDLSQYLRGSIADDRPVVPLSEELERVEAYLAIERARFGDRIHTQFAIDPACRACRIPPLVIQPLVENAIQHGLRHVEAGGVVRVTASMDDAGMRITIEDNGCGMDAATLAAVTTHRTPHHLGLANCDERLRLLYGPAFGLRITSHPGQGTRVEFCIPIGDGDCPETSPTVHHPRKTTFKEVLV